MNVSGADVSHPYLLGLQGLLLIAYLDVTALSEKKKGFLLSIW